MYKKLHEKNRKPEIVGIVQNQCAKYRRQMFRKSENSEKSKSLSLRAQNCMKNQKSIKSRNCGASEYYVAWTYF